jgi:hypothetical protein
LERVYLARKRTFLFIIILFLRGAHKEKKHFFPETNEEKQSNKQYDDHHVIEFDYTINKQNPASLGL